MKSAISALCIALSCLGAPASHALSLIDAYRLALTSDPTYLGARAGTDASRELVEQAMGNFMPTLGFSLSRLNSNTESTVTSLLGPRVSKTDYLAKNETLTLRQPLLRMDRVAQYLGATAQVESAEASLENERQSLALRVAGAYFDAVLALENTEFVAAQKQAYIGQLARAERALKAGAGTRTDIDEARARVDITIAREIDAANQVKQAERALSALISRPVIATSLEKLVAARLPLNEAALGSDSEWLQRAQSNSPQLLAALRNAEAAQSEIYRARAQHLPTVDFVASLGKSQSDTVTSIGQSYETRQLGIQVNIPLFSGGQTSSVSRQAVFNFEKYQQQVEGVRRTLSVNVSKELDAVSHGAAKIHAAEQALFSAEQSRISTEKGVLAGTRNNIDVLNAQQQELSARIDMLRSRYDFVTSWLRLNALAGGLSGETIEVTSRWLNKEVSVAN